MLSSSAGIPAPVQGQENTLRSAADLCDTEVLQKPFKKLDLEEKAKEPFLNLIHTIIISGLTVQIRRHHLQAVVRVLAVGLQPGGDVHHAAAGVVHLQDVVRPRLCGRPKQICDSGRDKVDEK